ncbi:thymidine phosphorylase [Mycoplasmoides pirum]|uniref:thymidine phosphorylase n=1 Tax=Mycoplasmoides pirum TaxID=2122 RepID=UPI000486D0BE|nr:thymidine phosphorylase [Mycoplasmoides pirum]
MNIIEIIELKKNKKKLSQDQINFCISGLVNKSIPDYQISALLMAIWFNGLDDNELYFLTKAMIDSGKIYKFHPEYKKILIDKHSTGGIGDKVSIALAPILVSFDLGVAKLSGRGLGFTGGTIDKLESINVNTDIDLKNSKKILNIANMFIVGQTNDIVPADKLLYALRDVTGTVDSLPLIAASILSKKFALESDYIFIDIKYGQGAFCHDIETAKKLSNIMKNLAKKFKRKVYFVLSDMNEVLGNTVGNAIEVKEAIDFLKNNSDVGTDFKKLMFDLVTLILLKTKKCKTKKEAKEKINYVLENKIAFNNFCNWIELQNGNIAKIKNDTFFKPKYWTNIAAWKSGKISYKSIIELAEIGVDLGSGRRKKEDKIDFQAGIYLHAKSNEKIKIKDKILTLYSSKPIKQDLIDKAKKIIKIS